MNVQENDSEIVDHLVSYMKIDESLSQINNNLPSSHERGYSSNVLDQYYKRKLTHNES